MRRAHGRRLPTSKKGMGERRANVTFTGNIRFVCLIGLSAAWLSPQTGREEEHGQCASYAMGCSTSIEGLFFSHGDGTAECRETPPDGWRLATFCFIVLSSYENVPLIYEVGGSRREARRLC